MLSKTFLPSWVVLGGAVLFSVGASPGAARAQSNAPTYVVTADFDVDGIDDASDNCPRRANYDQTDTDGDDVGDACDTCPGSDDPTQADMDRDGIGDACDPDRDGDGTLNDQDNCPDVSNHDQGETITDGIGDACNPTNPCSIDPVSHQMVDPIHCTVFYADGDEDGIEVDFDNCPDMPNYEQADLDADLLGDACDPDIDGDGVPNVLDNCMMVWNPTQTDLDRDGIGDGGNWSGAAESCDSKECYVVAGNTTDCSDPNAAFSIRLLAMGQHTAATEFSSTQPIAVLVFSNRLTARHTWNAELATRPPGSSAALVHATGEGTGVDGTNQVAVCMGGTPCSTWENIYFQPDVGGIYTVHVVATLPDGDQGPTTSSSSISIVVSGGASTDGGPGTDAGPDADSGQPGDTDVVGSGDTGSTSAALPSGKDDGCSCGATQAGPMAGLAAFVLAVLRRRRKTQR